MHIIHENYKINGVFFSSHMPDYIQDGMTKNNIYSKLMFYTITKKHPLEYVFVYSFVFAIMRAYFRCIFAWTYLFICPKYYVNFIFENGWGGLVHP